MFQFVYKGKFDCIITKQQFESHVKNLYKDLKKIFNLKFDPKKFIVTFEIDSTKSKGFGGYTDYDRKTDIIYYLDLQLFGYSKKEQTSELIDNFFGYMLTHEMFHFFLPSVKNNSCWSEGVTDFMTFWHKDSISENLLKLQKEYKEITDSEFKDHKYGYITGFKKMAKLYKDHNSIIEDIKQIIQDFNKNTESKKKAYTESDIISYNNKFKTFFTGNCNKHFVSKLD